MPSFKRPDLPPGALKELIDELHALHLEAGYPSTRTLEEDLEAAVVSHTTIHNVFTTGRLPRWGIVDVLAGALAKRAGRDERVEVERIHGLWTRAAEEKENHNPNLKFSKNAENPEVGLSGFTSVLSEIMPRALDEMEAIGSKVGIKNYRVTTGFDDLDALIGGWPPGALIIVGGRPSSGKTSLMLNFCLAASHGSKIASMFASAEEDPRALTLRILSSIAHVPLHYMRTGQLSDDNWKKLAHSMVEVVDAPLFFNASCYSSLDGVATEAAYLASRFGLRVIFVDGFLSYVDRDFNGNLSKVEPALRKLKDLARIHDIAVVVGVPTRRVDSVVARIDARLLPANEAIENVADAIIILDRPDQDDRETPRAGEADLWVVKNRYGPEAAITVAWQGHYNRFVDMSANEYPIFPAEKTEDATPEASKTEENAAPASGSVESALKDGP